MLISLIWIPAQWCRQGDELPGELGLASCF